MATTSFTKDFKIKKNASREFEKVSMRKPPALTEIKSKFTHVSELSKLKSALTD